MGIARQIFNSQYANTSIIDLFGKINKIDENGKTFWWLCLNEASNYLTFLRICELASCCCVIKNGKGFDIRVDINENLVLVSDIRKWLLTRKVIDCIGSDYGTIEKICTLRIYRLWILFRKKISWLKKLYSLQETKVKYEKSKSEDKKDDETDNKQEEKVTESKFKIDESQQTEESSNTQSSWWSSWSRWGSQKRDHSDDENEEGEKWCSSFFSMPETEKDKTEFSSQASKVSTQKSSSQAINILTQTSLDKNNDQNDDDDEGKTSFYVKVGKHKRLKYY